MAFDYKYPILRNEIYANILAFYNDLFKTSIRSAFDFLGEVSSYWNITLLFFGSNFGRVGVIPFCFQFPTFVQPFSISLLVALKAII